MVKKRIGILDGFRTVAILAVMLFHYYSRWIPPWNSVSLYPYGDKYNYFGLGYLGVQFFFIISGFVIFYTLEQTPVFGDFWKKRLIRLYPALLIISVIIFVFFLAFDGSNVFPESHSIYNFQFSLTFINPTLFNLLFHPHHFVFYYLNGSFWSLWPEVQFYVLASILFYLNKEKFTRNFLVLSIIVVVANWAMLHLFWKVYHVSTIKAMSPELLAHPFMKYVWYCFVEVFSLPQYLVHFALGITYYLLYQDKHKGIKPSWFIMGTILILFVFQCESVTNDIRVVYILMNLAFLCFIYFPDVLRIFENKYIAGIGVVSYIVYLFHENIGVFLIYTVGPYMGSLAVILPMILIVFFIVISNLYNKYIDFKVGKFLKKKLLKIKKV